jgi:hypothetical protein
VEARSPALTSCLAPLPLLCAGTPLFSVRRMTTSTAPALEMTTAARAAAERLLNESGAAAACTSPTVFRTLLTYMFEWGVGRGGGKGEGEVGTWAVDVAVAGCAHALVGLFPRSLSASDGLRVPPCNFFDPDLGTCFHPPAFPMLGQDNLSTSCFTGSLLEGHDVSLSRPGL